INLVVGDYFKLKMRFISVINDALEVCKWFNNHSRALGILRQQQSNSCSSSKPATLILPVLTRWTSHYLSVSRLLDLETTLRQMILDHQVYENLLSCAGTRADAKERAADILCIIESADFWNELRM
ncbi:hypothetical protein BDQ17DRAFT_1477629, partial [Cyathus striatus]